MMQYRLKSPVDQDDLVRHVQTVLMGLDGKEYGDLTRTESALISTDQVAAITEDTKETAKDVLQDVLDMLHEGGVELSFLVERIRELADRVEEEGGPVVHMHHGCYYLGE